MKIKTIIGSFLGSEGFDNEVNEAVDDGWQLIRREVIPGGPLDSNKLYAELVLPEKAPESETLDPFQALHTVQAFCRSIPAQQCNTEGGCPLSYWCAALERGGDPTDWELPEVE